MIANFMENKISKDDNGKIYFTPKEGQKTRK